MHHPLRACCVAAELRGEWVGEAAALVSELGIDLGDASASVVHSRALLSSTGLAVAVGSVGRAERIVCMCMCHAYACEDVCGNGEAARVGWPVGEGCSCIIRLARHGSAVGRSET